MRKILGALPHITIILSFMFITFWILDIYNPLMNFLSSDISKALLLIFSITSIITSMIAIGYERKLYDNRNHNEK